MFKLIKYELKSNFKEFIAILLTVVIFNLLLLIRRTSSSYGKIISLSTIIYIVSMVVILINSIKFMSKYIYEDSGYLLFTLPQSGYSILGSRLLASLLETLIVSVVGYLFIQMNLNYSEMIKNLFMESINAKTIILAIVSFCIKYIYLLTGIYFSIILGKVIFGDKKIGKFGAFIIFMILSISDGYISSYIGNKFPKEISINMFTNEFSYGLNAVQDIASINVARTILGIIIFLALFFGSVKLIENKLDL